MEHAKELIHRLNKIQGQIEALKRVITQDDKTCADVVYQIKAVKGALKKVGDIYADAYISSCITDGRDPKKSASEASEALKAILNA
ncbi:MAG: metal-sensitive transcriptional regulator [Candidatus Yonathbacteria bacterium]|nr:metal-sensitive transcriptional regulator [Candidatus Yonathbacteria bacterium]NTW48003.1 metal-sensitive transcriptional regulator [Candidatus Yonathbacteria bacterium]